MFSAIQVSKLKEEDNILLFNSHGFIKRFMWSERNNITDFEIKVIEKKTRIINLSEPAFKKLILMKIKLDIRSFDETISFLIDNYNK